MRHSLALLALLVAGCATTQTAVTDTFCLSPASKKRTWNPETDSVEAMRDAVVHNAYVDRRCSASAKKA